jgi:hypothetical protein
MRLASRRLQAVHRICAWAATVGAGGTTALVMGGEQYDGANAGEEEKRSRKVGGIGLDRRYTSLHSFAFARSPLRLVTFSLV